MRIKKLEIVGFKSFKDRTVIHFDAGITGVVGPNGCGKSNIVDALVWVMGEMSAKHLRGSSMEDVIFAGAEGYSPLGMAEVSLTLENDNGPFPAKYAKLTEIMVCRRLHRNGESQYLVNKETARLRDIQEIFMDTGAGSKGFSIIEQGAIGKIITAKPEDRRTLIEEAAGITKFKVRKRESQRKLAQTDQNLVRLQDIIGEQKRQLDSLQRQAQRAERYRNLKNDIRQKELWVASRSYLSLRKEIEEAGRNYLIAQDKDTSVTTDIHQMEANLEEIRAEVVEREKRVEELQTQRQKIQEQTQNLENMIRELGFEMEQARRNREMTGNILEQYQAREKALQNEKLSYLDRVGHLESLSSHLEQRFVVRQEEWQKVQKKISQADDDLTERRREMLAISQMESHVAAKQLTIETQIEELLLKVEKSRSLVDELTERQSQFLERKSQVDHQLEKEKQHQFLLAETVENYQIKLSSLKKEEEEKRQQVESHKDHLNKISSRLYGLENLHANFEGFAEGVKSIMLWQKENKKESGLFFPLSEVVEVPEKYELAMEAVLGPCLQALISEDIHSAVSAIDYLKEKKSGRSSFLSADWDLSVPDNELHKEVVHLSEQAGFVADLKEVIGLPISYAAQIKRILQGIVVVDTIATAFRFRSQYPRLTFVTLQGDVLSQEGVLTGGDGESVDSGMLQRRREIKELSVQREEWQARLSATQEEWKKIEIELKTLIVDLENAKVSQNEKEVLLAGLTKDLERAENECHNAQTALNRQKEEASREENQLLVLREKEEEIKDTIQETREKRLQIDSEVELLTQELKSSREGIENLQMEVTELKVESAAKKQELEGLRHQLKMVSQALVEVEQNLAKMSAESAKSTESLSLNSLKVEEQKLQLEKRIGEMEWVRGQLQEATNLYEDSAAQESEMDDRLSEALHSINENKVKLNETHLKLEQLRMKEQYLIDQIHERYQFNLADQSHELENIPGDLATHESELEDLKDKLKRIGEVNLAAIEEYDELSQRFQFLSQQHVDLIEAKENLRKVIDRINRICSRRFKETFELVNERFTKVFPVLFGGGEARLMMVEEIEHGEMGIDIVAKPPGKKLQNVGLLSGGEKALTAVSLIFSIFLVKPSPYCLLDEVDAPLDDANVFRFNELVREMAKRSQVIVVTHNKHTMKVADKLYGVTMEEKGVSKMVSVNLHEAEKVAEA